MIELIPAIDIIGGRCVRLTKGDFSTQCTYADDPVGVASEMEALGFTRLHVVDLDGAKSKTVVNIDTLRRITATTALRVDFGGGIKSEEDLQKVFDAGAAMATIGSIAVKDPQRTTDWLHAYGAEHLILGADVREGYISINGWKEDSTLKLEDFLDAYMKQGFKTVLCTDISKDGMLQGPATDLYMRIMQQQPNCHLIASGGVSSIDDIRNLDAAGIPAVVFGKAIYEGKIDLRQLLNEFPQR